MLVGAACGSWFGPGEDHLFADVPNDQLSAYEANQLSRNHCDDVDCDVLSTLISERKAHDQRAELAISPRSVDVSLELATWS